MHNFKTKIFSMSLVVMLCAIAPVLTQAEGYAYKLIKSSPDYTGIVDVPYQVAYKNIRAGFIKCHKYNAIPNGEIFADDKMAEIIVYTGGQYSSVLAVYEINAKNSSSSVVRGWGSKATFGSGFEFMALAAPELAKLGDQSDCAVLGF